MGHDQHNHTLNAFLSYRREDAGAVALSAWGLKRFPFDNGSIWVATTLEVDTSHG